MPVIIRRRAFISIILLACVVALPATSHAGLMDAAGRIAAWWKAGTIGAHAMDGDAVPDEAEEEEGVPGEGDDASGDASDPDDAGAAAAGVPGKCIVPQEPPVTSCSSGSGFLCVATPPGGEESGELILTGAIDRQSSVLASIEIVAQNDYTKAITKVDTRSPASHGCDASGAFARPFCLDAEGTFAAKVALPESGPYTISVSASQLSGSSVSKQVHASRVIAPKLATGGISFTPDIAASASVPLETTHVTVGVSLLGDCQFCDFIGASTHGVTVTVENAIRSADGTVKRVTCSTRSEQGGQGKFMLGVPVGPGQNSLTIRACNAAADGAGCPSTGAFAFSATGVVDAADAVEFLSPDPQPSYDMDDYPTIPWSFRMGDSRACVKARFNRDAAVELCPDASGVYAMELHPRLGINVVSLATGTGLEEFAWTFGWGKIASPHAAGDGAIVVPAALEAGITDRVLKDMLVPLINHYLVSDEFDALVAEMLSKSPGAVEEASPEPMPIPLCGASADEAFTTKLRGEPVVGAIEIENVRMEKGALNLTVDVHDALIGLDLVPKKDLPPLPLVVSIRKALIDVTLASREGDDGRPLLLLTSPHDDCEYKSATYCRHMPAPLIFKNLVGGATSWGGFVKCDVSAASGKAKEACAAINSLNAQTAVISEKVLDAVNEALYCGGSALLTRAARNGVTIPPVVTGCVRDEPCEGIRAVLPSVRIPLGVTLSEGLGISAKGLMLSAGLSFGDKETFAHAPAEAAIPTAGIIVGRDMGEAALDAPGGFGAGVNAALSLDAVGALLFTAIAQGDGKEHRGLLDVDVHEGFFQKLGFDFVKACDQEMPAGSGEERSQLCLMRPRVSELLGTALTTYGYFEGKHPLLLAVRGNRALGPRVAVVGEADIPAVSEGGEGQEKISDGTLIAIDIGGLTLSFYALEVDEAAGADAHGNPKLKLDQEGNPLIHSMRPDDPDSWNGPIVSFDLTLLLGARLGEIAPDPADASHFVLRVGLLGDRSRVVLTPVPGSNATTVPAAGLVSSLAETLKIGMTLLGSFDVPVPREILFEADEEGQFGMLGLSKIALSEDGLTLGFDAELNKAKVALAAALTQVLHAGGEEQTFEVR